MMEERITPQFGIEHRGARHWRNVREMCGSVNEKQYVLPLLLDRVDVAWHTI